MAGHKTTRVRPAGRVVDFLVDGKRTVLASGLILVMAVMWIRILVGHKPDSAAAAPEPTQTAPVEPQEPARIRMVDVPKIPGRNDSIYRDCFNIEDRAPFRRSAAIPSTSTDTEVPVVPPNHDQEVIQQVAQTLKLEAVLRSDSPRAFLNDRLLKTGDRFTVERGAGFLEFEVLRIYDDAVLVECNDVQLTLKLAQVVETRK